MAQDGAQEERSVVLRHPVADRHRASPIAPVIIESCPTRIFLPNAWALEPQRRRSTALWLNDRQIEILSRATPKRDYYVQSRAGERLFDLGWGRSPWRSAPPPRSPTRPIAAVIAAHGPADFADAWLRHRRLPWAADLLTSITLPRVFPMSLCPDADGGAAVRRPRWPPRLSGPDRLGPGRGL
jgi:hypothetical protein